VAIRRNAPKPLRLTIAVRKSHLLHPAAVGVPPAIIEDPSAPAVVTGSGTTATTASFTPVANSLIVALAAGGAGSAVETCPVTDSLGSTWTLLKRANTNNFAGVAEVWVLDAGASPAARTVTATITGSTGVGVALTVKVLTGAKNAAACLGGFTVTPTTTAYSVSVTTTTVDSLACGVLMDSTSSGALTANGISTAWQAFSDVSNGHKAGTFRATNLTTTPGATVIGFSNTAANNQAVVGVEILAAPPAGPPALATPPVVAGGTTIGGTPTLGATVSPAVVTGTATVGTAAPTVGATATPTVVTGLTTVGAPVISTGSLAAPAVLAGVAAVPAPVVKAGSTVTAVVAAGVATIPTPTSDITAPSVPTGLTVTASSEGTLDVSWTASTDNTGIVSQYEVRVLAGPGGRTRAVRRSPCPPRRCR
jgi:hypothetical protein